MPIPEPVLYPPFHVVRLSHVALTVTDLGAARAFWSDTLGLHVTDETPDRIYLRGMEERGHHSLVLERAESPTVQVLGFKVFCEEDLDRAKSYFEAIGVKSAWVDVPFQGRTLRGSDPMGIPFEFYFTMDKMPSIHQKYAFYKGVKPLRIDHCNCFSPDVQASVDFYNAIGFRTSEYTESEDNGALWAVWMHRKGNVHDLAFTHGVGPRLHHVAFWVPTPLNIIDLLDLMSTTGYVSNIERGPGRHGISNALFLYVRDPDGHRIELYCSDYLTIDPDHKAIKWDLRDPQRQTLWGAPAPRSWFEEGTVFAGTPVRPPNYEASPIIAA